MSPRNDEPRGIPAPTLRRFPAYLSQLFRLQEEGRDVVSSTHLGKRLMLDPVQVRKDLECTGLVGRPKVGHSVPKLIEAIESILGWNRVNEAFLVGAGNLGAALLGYPRFKQSGLDIVAAFDEAPEKVGSEIHGKTVLPLKKLANLTRRMGVKVGIIAVPADHAQAVADLMVEAGILAIWNFAPVTLRVPEEVIVQTEDLYSGLAILTQKLAVRLREEPSKGVRHAHE
ncbi:MAG TPA: redox-sensing transcriptional repressor Rex [Myxococcales bacterium]|jgi:redox-sensing transcriptional repressor|nr:redox-sensing transcriptional repressor Rex [Myxococcales bacterium]